MDADYKGHHIIVSASHNADRNGWEPHINILVFEGDKTSVKPFTIDQICATEEEAKQAGLSVAKKWIDDGEPEGTDNGKPHLKL